MIKDIQFAKQGLISQMTKLEVISNNIANASTIGFRKQKVFEEEIAKQTELLQTPTNTVNQVKIDTFTSFESSRFEQTGNPLDLSIEIPNGFFQLEDELGNFYLTKAGNFSLSKDGYIVAKDGKFLLGENGRIKLINEIVLDSSQIVGNINPKIKITERGDVFVNEAFAGRISILKVENPETLERIEGTYFRLSGQTRYVPNDPFEAILRQGWLEISNVDIIKEMINLIEVQRLFELNTKVVQSSDSTLEQSLRLGKFV